MKIGVISDIHSHKKSKEISQGGYYFPNMVEKPTSQNPFAALKSVLRSDESKLDFIMCPGDLAHQIDPDGLKSSWDQLKLLKNEVNAELLIATIGNHDVASRDGKDVFKYVKEFDLDFPVYFSKEANTYKKRLIEDGYYTIDNPRLDVLVVVINSCFDHWDKVEASKGKIETESLDILNETIKSSERNIKLGLIHHHPIVHETGIHDTADIIEGCEALMSNISGLDMIIHGHKHDYRFSQEKVYPENLNILSSGSFSCFKTYLKTGSLNYYHEIEFETEIVENCKKQGMIRTYAYDPTKGWTRYKNLDEGFGCVLTVPELEKKMADEIDQIHLNYIEWIEICERIPYIEYTPKKVKFQVLDQLKEDNVIKRYNTNKDGIGDIILR